MSNNNKYNKILLDLDENYNISNEYPKELEGNLTKDEYEQFIGQVNHILKNPLVSRKYYLAPVVIIFFLTFLVFLLYFVDAFDKYTSIALGVIIGIGSLFSITYYAFKRNENIKEQLTQLNIKYAKNGVKIVLDSISVNDRYEKMKITKVTYNIYYLKKKENKPNDDIDDKYRNNTIQLSRDNDYVVEMESIPSIYESKKEQKESLLSNNNNINYNDDEPSSSAIIHQENED
ncbi:hypothetical protein DICPUDRAFT_151375 [Dictyostelium purpureum]|uniref:Uncharacterized protein n=1 Tax=Dictyostelium purpureum TaxID=5786 RepID=F0ZIN9_DICPU|nr:uncharacterized protein DICPUDRAFT_151375 [Dictyostelium purpureum]EGC36201.1 hypothetical protein DICPUDRAFT_151375 [Dictyostelium purpureum]|eukprot:XP_003287268.1 hypothetical protein DICPUDRAFT_151375 [Dictyostelium purpureum]